MWNVSKVINMMGMFLNSFFNGDISRWDMRAVCDCGMMFFGGKFNQEVKGWKIDRGVYIMICLIIVSMTRSCHMV